MRDNTKSAEGKSAYEKPIVMKFDDIARSTGKCMDGNDDGENCYNGSNAGHRH